MAETLQEKILEADGKAQMYLGNSNEASERGDREKADRLYAKAQFWLDRLNKLSGNS